MARRKPVAPDQVRDALIAIGKDYFRTQDWAIPEDLYWIEAYPDLARHLPAGGATFTGWNADTIGRAWHQALS